jgi:hypothetical protein
MLFRQQQHQASGDQKQPKNDQNSQKKRKQKALYGLSESETIDKSQTASKQNKQRINKQQKSNILSVIAYTIIKKRKNQTKKKICSQV